MAEIRPSWKAEFQDILLERKWVQHHRRTIKWAKRQASKWRRRRWKA